MLKLLKGLKGQTLLEVVVTVGVALVIIGSLITLMNSINRRSNIARQANQASKLAQEGMEIVRNIRDINAPGAVQSDELSGPDGACVLPFYCSFGDIYYEIAGNGTDTVFLQNCGAGGSWCLVGTTEPLLLDIFTRSVIISDDPDPTSEFICSSADLDSTQTKRITVRVEWESPSGHQTRTATTCLTRWQD